MSNSIGGISWIVDADTSGATNSVQAMGTQVGKATGHLKKLDSQTKSTEKKVFKLKDQFKSFGKNAGAAVASIDGPLGGISSRISALTTLMTTGGIATTTFAAALAALTYVVAKGVKELDALNMSNARAAALIKATGGAAGKTTAQLEAQAKALALNTLAGTEGVQKAQAILLTFKSVQGDVFDRAIALSQDLASVMGTDIKSAAMQMGKALNDPITGMTALRRSGVSFTEEQKDMVKALVKSGEQLKAQELILAEIESQYTGAAQAVAAGSLAGAIDTLGQSFDEMSIEVATSSGALDIFEYTISRIAAGMRKFTKEKLAPKVATEDFNKAMDLMWEIADLEDKLAKESSGIVKSSLEAKIFSLKREREEYLKSAKEKSESENKELKLISDNILKVERLREKAKKDAIARQKKLATEKRTAAELKQKLTAAAAEKKSNLSLANSIIESDKTEEQKRAEKIAKFEALRKSDLANEAIYQDAIDALKNKPKKEAIEAAVTTTESIISRGDTDQSEFKAEMELLEENHNAKLISEELYQAALTQMQAEGDKERSDAMKAATDATLSSFNSAFSTLASILKESESEQSNSYAAMFAIAKGFAVAQAGLNFASAVMAAFNDPSAITLPQKISNIAAATAAGAGLLSAVSSASYSGRENGGSVIGGQTYEVGEKNKPEMLMIPGNNGKVFSNNEMKGMIGGNGGGGLNQTINNYGSADGYQVQTRGDGITTPQVIDIIRSEMGNANSQGRRALGSTSSVANVTRSRR